MSVINSKVSWANSASQFTAVLVTPSSFGVISNDSKFLLSVENPSSVSALTISVQNVWVDSDGTERTSDHATTLAVATSKNASFIIDGVKLKAGGQLEFSIDTGLGGSDAFSAHYRLEKIGGI